MTRGAAPEVSVLLPAYNEPVLVKRAVESVLDQTYRSFELVIIDDASTDDTGRTLAAYADQPQVRVLSNSTNLGLVGTLNRGLNECRGTLVARIDQDDWCEPTRLERQAAVFHRHERTVLCATGYIRASTDGERQARTPPVTHAALAAAMLGGNRLPHSGVMFTRDAALSVGGYDPMWYPADDYDLWLRLLQVGEYRGVPSAEVYYSHNPEGISRTRAAEQTDRARRRAALYRASLLGKVDPADALSVGALEFDRCARALTRELTSRGIDTDGVDEGAWRAARTVLLAESRRAVNLRLGFAAPRLATRRVLQKAFGARA